MRISLKSISYLLLSGIPGISAAQAAINIYVSAPKSQTIDSTIMEASTENFNSATAGAITTYISTVSGVTYSQTTGTASIVANSQYGGYQQANYLGINANSSATITLATSQEYFGLFYTAADANNFLQIYSGNTLLTSFSTATLLSFLPNTTTGRVNAIDGSTYNTQDYYGQPTSGRNSGEAYAYLSFIATDGTTFDRVVLSQRGGAVFESDNHSYRTTAPTVPGTYVLVPEPSTWLLLGLGALGLFVVCRKNLV